MGNVNEERTTEILEELTAIIFRRVREGGEATRCFCIVGTVICWLLLLLLTLTAHQAGSHRESSRLFLWFVASVCHKHSPKQMSV